MTIKKAAVLGGGNASHTIAADLTLKGLTVNLFEMEQFAGSMSSSSRRVRSRCREWQARAKPG